MKFGSILCVVVELVLCDNGIFVNDGVEDIIYTFFKKENSKILDAPLSSDSEIDTALFKMQENIDGYIDYFSKQIPIYIRQIIKDVTDKNLPKDFNINTSSPTEYLIKNCDIERLKDIINFFYCSKINELRSIIAFYFYNIALDVPNFSGLFSVTFFEDKFLHIEIIRMVIVHFANKAIEIAASKTSLSKEFDDYFNDNVVSRFNKMYIHLKDRVLFMIRIFQINKRLIKNSTSKKFSILNVANYTENKPSGMYKADIISYLKKLMDEIVNCKKILETKSYDDLLDVIKTEFIYIKNNVKLLTTDERLTLIAFTKTKLSNNIQTFYDEIKVIAETIGQNYKSLDKHILKLGDEKIAKLKEYLKNIYVEIQSSAYNNKLLVENIIEEISDKITSKKEIISRKDLEKYIIKVDHSIDHGKGLIIYSFFDFEYDFKKFIDYVYVDFDCDKICLHGLDIASTEILLKINEI
ncbi:hypothetical protein COBT_002807 [Conglomerata obtusa]